MNNVLPKIIMTIIVSVTLAGCNPANYGWSDCDQEIQQMFLAKGITPDSVQTTIEKEEPSGWYWGNEEPEDAWFVTQTFNFSVGDPYHLTFNSTGSSCQVVVGQ